MQFELPALPYSYEALEPYIDAQTMYLHHDKHHQAYLDKLNEALAKYPELDFSSDEELLKDFAALPEDIAKIVRNQGGGFVNHNLFWQIMGPPNGIQPTGELAEAIAKSFANLTNFQTKFNEAGVKHFGSGWVWLVKDRDGSLQITSTSNQDSPLSEGLYPLLANDVWEHAYYLKYQNRRAEYLQAWWSVVNWEAVERRFQSK